LATVAKTLLAIAHSTFARIQSVEVPTVLTHVGITLQATVPPSKQHAIDFIIVLSVSYMLLVKELVSSHLVQNLEPTNSFSTSTPQANVVRSSPKTPIRRIKDEASSSAHFSQKLPIKKVQIRLRLSVKPRTLPKKFVLTNRDFG
jgi:hypothetical protein